MLRAQTLWDELAALTEERIFERTGVVNLGPASSTFLATVEESAKAYRLDVERLDANGIMARWPEISVPEDYIGLFEANSGVLHSETAIKTWIDLAAKAGCAQLFNCPVTGITHHAEGSTVTTSEGEYTATRLLVSAGTWVTKLLPDLPIQPVRKSSPGSSLTGVTAARTNSRRLQASYPMATSSTVSRKRRAQDWQT